VSPPENTLRIIWARFNVTAFHTCSILQFRVQKGMEMDKQTKIARQFIEAIPHSKAWYRNHINAL